tara:strand:+ start:447 stop:1007 length:561 start_codon:yes stop_codon:yes gene_type:complete
MTLMTTGSTPSAAGYSEKADASGPVAGVSPRLNLRAKIKDKKKLVHPDNKLKENAEPSGERSRLFQYKVKIPNVGETIIFASNPAELRMKLRMSIMPKLRPGIEIERILPANAAKYWMDRRMNAMRNVNEQGDDHIQQDMARGKIAIEKKKVILKKQAMQKQLQQKTLKLKKQAKVGGVKQDVDAS